MQHTVDKQLQSIRVTVRIRPDPCNSKSTLRKSTSGSNGTTDIPAHGADPSTFRELQANAENFAGTVLGPEATQRDVYRTCGAALLDALLNGYNGCLFAYVGCCCIRSRVLVKQSNVNQRVFSLGVVQYSIRYRTNEARRGSQIWSNHVIMHR